MQYNSKDSLQKIIRDAAFAGQLGVSLITPPILLAFFGWYISNKLGIGSWITVVFILLGLATSFAIAYNFYKKAQKRFFKDDKKDKSISFREHL